MASSTAQSIAERIKNSFARQSLMETFQAQVALAEKGRVVISAPILTSTQQQHGFAHAGLTFAIGDSAAGYSALTEMAEGFEVVTSEMKINLLAPATGEFLRAEGRVIKAGKRLVVATAEVTRDDGTLVALLQGTLVPVPITSG